MALLALSTAAAGCGHGHANAPQAASHAPSEGHPSPCALRHLGGEGLGPQQVEREGCSTAHCLPVDAERAVCKCESADGGRLFVERPGGTLLVGWPGSGFMGDTDRFEALLGDLDDDGREELIVASHRVASSGFAVDTWNLAVLDGGAPTDPPLTFSVEDYGTHSFGSAPGGAACDVLATEWLESDDPVLGTGYYRVSRAYAYTTGALRPRAAPVTARRARVGEDPELRERDPAFDDDVPAVARGRIRAAGRSPDQLHSFALWVEVDLEGGGRVVLGGDGPQVRLADARTRRAYPEGYVPAEPGRLVGRWVGIERRDPSSPPRWLWLE